MNQLSISSISKLTSVSLEQSLFTLSCRYFTVQTSRPSFKLSSVVILLSISLFGRPKRQKLYRSSCNLWLVLSHTMATLITLRAVSPAVRRCWNDPQLFYCKLALSAGSSLPSSLSLITRSSSSAAERIWSLLQRVMFFKRAKTLSTSVVLAKMPDLAVSLEAWNKDAVINN